MAKFSTKQLDRESLRSTIMSNILVLAYGNPLRSDDGIAWRAAEELARTLPPTDVEIRCLHQLTPELADQASRATAVIFLDARCAGEPGAITCAPVNPQFDEPPSSHHVTPQSLISLCRRLYAATPRSFIVSLSGQSFDFGESLSPAAESALPHFVATVRKLVEDLVRSDQSATTTARSFQAAR
jgi:hydrogenase maturation protease